MPKLKIGSSAWNRSQRLKKEKGLNHEIVDCCLCGFTHINKDERCRAMKNYIK